MGNLVKHLQAILALAAVNSTLAAPDNFPPKLPLSYSTVTGYFLQDDPATNPTGFDYTAVNFGLKNRTYDRELEIPGLTQWQKFAAQVDKLNLVSFPRAEYKVVFLGRHGEGYHNAAESYYGTPAWNCYWAELDGNGTSVWADAHLTPAGTAQAQRAHDFWAAELRDQRIRAPDSYFVSPLSRCLATAQHTFAGLRLPPGAPPFRPTVKEALREGISIHTCDRRGSRAAIAADYPSYSIEPGFAELDPLWSGVRAETASAQDARSRAALDDIFAPAARAGSFVSVTSHSGEIASILRVLGHRPFSLATGAIIPVLVKAEFVPPAPTSTVAWTPSPHCTVPPVTSISGGACVCPNGAAPVTSTLAGATPLSTS